MIQLSERHQISSSHPFFTELSRLTFLSKNLYNSVLYLLRKEWFSYLELKKVDSAKGFQFLSHADVCRNFAATNQLDYRALPAKVAQHVVQQCFRDLKSFRALLKVKDARPNLPRYKDKTRGRNLLIYTNQALSKDKILGLLKLSGTNIAVPVQTTQPINQVRVVPTRHHFVIEIIYTQECINHVDNGNIASIDIGVNNLAALTFNNSSPILLCGGPLKSINQFYNKEKAKLQACLTANKHWSHQLSKLTLKRNNKITDYLHKASRFIINHLVSLSVTTLVIGRNIDWKQGVKLGKKNNQNFVNIPFYKFIEMLKYKAELMGIRVIEQEESYTSKCSFLDQESIERHDTYQGARIKRGLFKTSMGKLINADANGSANIMRKAIPIVSYTYGIEAVVVQPRRVKSSKEIKWSI